MNAQLAQHFKDGREDQAVALQFDDDQVAHLSLRVGQHVVELQSRVNGQPLRLGAVHQGDAVEVVVHVGLQLVDIEVQMLTNEQPLFFVGQIHVLYLDALLLRAPVVVLRLDFHELQVRTDVCAEAQLLAVGVARLVLLIHAERARVEISGVVEHVALTVNLLGVVVALGHA